MELSDGARLFFIGLISNADDDGRGIAIAKTLKARIFPADGAERITAIEQEYKREVAEHTHTVFYEAEGSSYYALLKWKDYQNLKGYYNAGACPAPSAKVMAGSFKAPVPEAELFGTAEEA